MDMVLSKIDGARLHVAAYEILNAGDEEHGRIKAIRTAFAEALEDCGCLWWLGHVLSNAREISHTMGGLSVISETGMESRYVMVEAADELFKSIANSDWMLAARLAGLNKVVVNNTVYWTDYFGSDYTPSDDLKYIKKSEVRNIVARANARNAREKEERDVLRDFRLRNPLSKYM